AAGALLAFLGRWGRDGRAHRHLLVPRDLADLSLAVDVVLVAVEEEQESPLLARLPLLDGTPRRQHDEALRIAPLDEHALEHARILGRAALRDHDPLAAARA